MTGRPTLFTDELASHICAEISSGRKVSDICEDEGMPAPSSVYLWLSKHPSFSEQYARAQADRTHAMAEAIIDISDDGANDWMERHHGDDVAWVANGEAIQRSKLRVDSRKWLMSKMLPKVYGDTIKQVHTDPDGKPLNVNPTIIFTGCPANTPSPETVDGTTDGSE